MQFHQCRPEDLPSINALIEGWYGKERKYSPHQFNWAFFDRDPGPSLLLGAVEDQKIIGTQAVLPIKMRAGEKTFWSGKSEETLLHKDFRGQGIFGKLYNEIFNMIDPDINVIWGTTAAKKPLEKCGFTTPTNVIYTMVFTGAPAKVFPIGEVSVAKKQKAMRRLFSLYHRMIRHKTSLLLLGKKPDPRVVEEVDFEFYYAVWKKMAAQFPYLVSVERSESWLKWRFEKNPHREYRMLKFEDSDSLGGLIFTANKQTGAIYLVDFVANGLMPSVANALVDRLVSIAKKEGYSSVVDIALDVDLAPQNARIDALTYYGSFRKHMKGLYLVKRISPMIEMDREKLAAENWYYSYLMTHGYRV